jgi:hypothetical protein
VWIDLIGVVMTDYAKQSFKTAPEMKEAWELAKNMTAPETSFTLPYLPRGVIPLKNPVKGFSGTSGSYPCLWLQAKSS